MRPLPGFGGATGDEGLARQFPKLSSAVTAGDRIGAAREIARTDGNGDGIVTEAEWAASGYQTPDRFKVADLNGDGRVGVYEHTLRWVLGRLEKERYQQQQQQNNTAARATGGSAAGGAAARDPLIESRQRQTQDLAAYILPLYDRNRNGIVERAELQSSSALGHLGPADADQDGTVTQAELFAWMRERLATQGPDLPDDAPAWFLLADLDQDGQVHLSELLRSGRRDLIPQFERSDRNSDGFVTARELASPGGDETLRHASGVPHVIEAEHETFAQILISDDVAIKDIDVQIAVAKNGDDDIELNLIGPDGTRATLYFDARAKPWGGGRLFENTLIDDEAPEITQRLVRPPLHRAFRSQGMKTPGMQGLKAFYGKPARGVWRLAVNNKSQVAGLLEGWALIIKPAPQAGQPRKP
jgi:Ca2+-binding EF-hand superfamily protein/subtilisin-like proprotein convertase family protein